MTLSLYTEKQTKIISPEKIAQGSYAHCYLDFLTSALLNSTTCFQKKKNKNNKKIGKCLGVKFVTSCF